jgi:hypothetical protein
MWWPDAYPDTSIHDWRVQRIPYPRPPYVAPIIEDFNNAEVVNQYLLQYLWNAGALVFPVRERDMNGAAAFVDEDEPESDGAFESTGLWTVSGSGGYNDGAYFSTASVTGAPSASAVWAATLPADGEYAVYAWYRAGTNRAPDARYVVHHAGGDTVVTINQRLHGFTWRYLGTYGFEAGEDVRLTLTNQSGQAGRIVVADAVRIGGGTFDDLTGIDTDAVAPPYEPWWEMAAYYYTQRMGGPEVVGDVTARPIYARWEHAGTGDDAVYVSWHTNGVSGYQETYRGTMSIIHNGEGYDITPGSEELRDIIHAELVNDIRAGWDPTWPDEKRSMNLGELRMLWDDDPADRMPGALFEIAYHDHPGDTDALREPSFGLLTARAMYQGIVRYFEQRDGIDLTLLPEPPTHLAVENRGAGRVRVSWLPSPTDSVGLVGDPATGYRVYTSTNGLGWSNGVNVTAGTVMTLTGLSEGQLLFVRVTGTNGGGESFPTETLAVRVGDDPQLLLVNGFDRLNRTMAVVDIYDPTGDDHRRMFLGQMNRYDYSIQHGEAIARSFDGASNEALQAGRVTLDHYTMVDWIVGEEAVTEETLNAVEQALLAGFWAGGGALFISGAEIGWDLDDLGSASDRAFYNNTLRAAFAGDDSGTYVVAPVSGSIFAGLPSFRFDAPGMYDAEWPDQLVPTNGSVAALSYSGGLGGTAAVQYENGCQRLVHFGFPFETIEAEDRSAVMGRVIDHLDECALPPLGTTIVSPVDGAFYQRTPPLQGTASGGAGIQRVEVAVRRQGDDRWWNGTGWVSNVVWLTAQGTTNWSYTLPELAVGEYDIQARAQDTEGRWDTTLAYVSFRMVDLSEQFFLPSMMRGSWDFCEDIIANGGFETDAGWTVNTQAVYSIEQAYSGARSGRVGILPGGSVQSGYSSFSQQLELPAGKQVALRLWVYPFAEGGDAGDWHYVGLTDASHTYHAVEHWSSDAREWQQRVYNLSDYAGQTVTLYVGTRNDADDDTAAMYVDDVEMEVCP